jgi:hypothetical protein
VGGDPPNILLIKVAIDTAQALVPPIVTVVLLGQVKHVLIYAFVHSFRLRARSRLRWSLPKWSEFHEPSIKMLLASFIPTAARPLPRRGEITMRKKASISSDSRSNVMRFAK